MMYGNACLIHHSVPTRIVSPSYVTAVKKFFALWRYGVMALWRYGVMAL